MVLDAVNTDPWAARGAEFIGNPADGAEIPRRNGPPEEVRVWSPRQVLAFLSDPQVQAHAYYAVYATAFDTGLRRGEVLGLTPADLHLDVATPYLRVRRTLLQDGTTDEPKTNAAKRRVPLPTAASVAVLRAALARRAEPGRPARAPQMWHDYRGRPLSPNAVGKAFTVLVKRFIASPVRVELDAPEITLHGTRHSLYANCRAAGMSTSTASRLLGHTSEVFSQVTYGHLTDDEVNTLPVLYDRVAA